MQRTQCNENHDFAKCEIPTESEPSDQHAIWTVDPTHVGGPRHPGTGVGDQGIIGISDIGKSEFLRLKETRDRKSRNPEGIETVHLRDRRQKSETSRHIANRDIGDPGHKGFVQFEIAIREIPISGVQLSAQQRRRTED
jgi:hypothetical protein